MAARQASSQLMDRVSCGVCMEQYDYKSHVPKLLPCQHTFCQSCIVQTTNKDRFPKTLKCPTCRQQHTVPSEGFITNRAVLDIVDELQKDPTIETERQTNMGQPGKRLRCEKHASKEAILVCIQCLHGLCLTCVKTSSTSHSGHQLYELDEALPLLQDKLKEKFAAREKELQFNNFTLHSSSISPAQITKVEEDIKSIRDKISSEVDAWADTQLTTIQPLKEKIFNQEQEIESELDTLKINGSDLTSLIQKLLKPENNTFYENHLNLISSAYRPCKYSEQTQGLLESIHSTLTSEESLQSTFLRNQLELHRDDVRAPEKHSTHIGRISDYRNSDALCLVNIVWWCLIVSMILLCMDYKLKEDCPGSTCEKLRSQTLSDMFMVMLIFQCVLTVVQMLSRKIVTLEVVDNSAVSAIKYTFKFFLVMLGIVSCPLWYYVIAVHNDDWFFFETCIILITGSCAIQLISPDVVWNFCNAIRRIGRDVCSEILGRMRDM